MKNIFTALCAVVLTVSSYAQSSLYFNSSYFSSCNSATNSISPLPYSLPGLYPADSSLPCGVIGQYVHDTIYFHNYATFSVATVNSLKFDSIYLPAGLCWSTNKSNNTFAGGEDGAIYISGIPTAPAGQYKLRMIVDLNATVIGNVYNIDLETLAHLRYSLRVSCGNNPCEAYIQDTVNVYDADNRACNGTGNLSAYITANGPTTLCTGDSVTLTANSGTGYTYLWSNGASSQSIVVSSSGIYSVNIFHAPDSATSNPVTVTVAPCVLNANITTSGSTNICAGSSVTLTASAGTNYSYIWSTGATTQSITTSTAGSYTVTVSDGVYTVISNPVVVTVNTGCTISYLNTNYFSSCNAATNFIAPMISATPGLYPADSSLPCGVVGQAVNDTIYFTNYSTFSVATVNSLKFDSIYLPAGLCWSTNKSNNTFAGGEDGVIYISGIPTAPAGQYKLRMIADLNATVIGNVYNIDLETLVHLRYYLRISCSGAPCAAVDQADSNSIYVSYNGACSFTAGISAGGPTTFCQGGQVTLTAAGGPGYTYLWSTGATSQSIIVTASGSYTATVTSDTGDIAISNTISVVVNPAPYAHFILTPDPATPHVWTAVNQCTGNNLTYSWVWGDNSVASTGATPSHNYDSAGYYDICVFVTDSSGCAASYCDSSAYLYKSENQMITMNVIQSTTGINDQQMKAFTASYYAGAIHFTPSVTSTAGISLYDMSGRVIMKENNWTGSSLPVDAGIASGIYIMTIRDNNSALSQRLPILR